MIQRTLINKSSVAPVAPPRHFRGMMEFRHSVRRKAILALIAG